MWVFHQPNGIVEDAKGFLYHGSYAGHNEGKNNPALQDVHGGCRWDADKQLWIPVDGLSADDWGPLPCGLYVMQPPQNTAQHGPFVMWLTPDPSNEMFGRSGFGWHGDSVEHPGLGSDGCICSLFALRSGAWGSNDHQLQVVAE